MGDARSAPEIGKTLHINFGKRDAPDHTTQESDSATYFIKKELMRLDTEYPTRAPELQYWLEHRRKLRSETSTTEHQFLWDVLC